MIKRDRRGHSYCGVRGEILGSPQDELLRKHLPRMFSLIKNESHIFDHKRCQLSVVAKLKLTGIDGRTPQENIVEDCTWVIPARKGWVTH